MGSSLNEAPLSGVPYYFGDLKRDPHLAHSTYGESFLVFPTHVVLV